MRRERLLVIGAGEAGAMIAHEFSYNERLNRMYSLVGFIDDRKDIKSLSGYPVLGGIAQVTDYIRSLDIDVAVIAIPSARNDLIDKITGLLAGCNVRIKIVPGFFEIIEGRFQFDQIRDFQPDDLLGREEISFDLEQMSPYFQEKTIFVTGAGGSIGSEIVVQLLSLPVKKVILFGRGENSIHSLIHKIKNYTNVDYVIGNSTDYKKLYYEMNRYKPDILFHAAAHKHVPLMERYPDEALKNNVLSTYYVAQAAINSSVKRMIFISSDKAVNPTSVMGASKRMGEQIIMSFDKLYQGTRFSLVRFGNVLGSRGSVIQIFKTQIENGGPVTVTHPEMTRFFMSIREAARLVIKSCTLEDGKIFILDMGKPIKILDLAKNMINLYSRNIREIKIEFTGLREGEKLYEELLTDNEKLMKTNYEKIFILNDNVTGMDELEIKSMLKDIRKAIDSYNKEFILQIIKKYVPEYHHY